MNWQMDFFFFKKKKLYSGVALRQGIKHGRDAFIMRE